MEQLKQAWTQLQGSVTSGQNVSAISLTAYLLLGGLSVRMLYGRGQLRVTLSKRTPRETAALLAKRIVSKTKRRHERW